MSTARERLMMRYRFRGDWVARRRAAEMLKGWAKASSGCIRTLFPGEPAPDLLSLEEARDLLGGDWKDISDQRAHEIQAFKDSGLPVPTWQARLDKRQATVRGAFERLLSRLLAPFCRRWPPGAA